MALTYPPRALVLALALALLLEGLLRRRQRLELPARRRWLQASVMGVAATCLAPQLDWGGGCTDPPPGHLTVLSYNVHHNGARAPDLARLAERRGAEILCLQEVRAGERQAFIEALPGYSFFWADENERIEHWNYGPISSVIAIAKSVLGDDPVELDTAITGYRTFAVRAQVGAAQLWIVNVHTTKSFWSPSDALSLMTRARYKATWHRFEREHLLAWLDDHQGQPTIIAGDFNAPAGTVALDLPGTVRAHAVAGEGWHRTAPAALPLWGIDHILAAGAVQFFTYETIDPGMSDHLAQVATFTVGGERGSVEILPAAD